MIGGLLSVPYLWFLDGQLEQLRGSERDQADYIDVPLPSSHRLHC